MIRYAKLNVPVNVKKIQQELQEVLITGNWLPHFNSKHHTGHWTVLALRSPAGSSDTIIPDLINTLDFRDTSLMQQLPSIQNLLQEFECEIMSARLLNYIDYVYLWNGSKAISALTFNDYRGDTYLNTGKQTNKGVETGADIHFSEQWQPHANISYNDGQLKYDPSFVDKSKTLGHHVQVYSNGAFCVAFN